MDDKTRLKRLLKEGEKLISDVSRNIRLRQARKVREFEIPELQRIKEDTEIRVEGIRFQLAYYEKEVKTNGILTEESQESDDHNRCH